MSLVERICQNKQCGVKFLARKADVARGWGLFCSKSCKAIKQEQQTGQYTKHKYWHSLTKAEQNQIIHNQIEDQLGWEELNNYGNDSCPCCGE